MNLKIIRYFLFILSNSSICEASNDYLICQEKVKVLFYIDDKQVSKKKFFNLISTLVQVPDTWYCVETSSGGRIGYDMRNKDGRIYSYTEASESNDTKRYSLKLKSSQ